MAKYAIVVWHPGPNWLPDRTVFDQPLDEHVAYLEGLAARGIVFAAGPFTEGGGGMTLLRLDDPEVAQRLIADDPAVQAGIITGQLRTWSTIVGGIEAGEGDAGD